MGKPLEGIKVIEVAMWAFVPVAGGMLSDMGATVIKVEPPTGDPIRGLRTGLTENEPALDYSWESYNRGKRSITLDLKQESGREVLYRLLEDADVLLTNLLPPARKAMKIDAETLQARFPKLIYATGSALGQNGPDSDKVAIHLAFQSPERTLTDEDADLPVGPPGPAFGDSLSGSMLAGGIAAAIAKRAMTGEVSSVDVSLLGAALWSQQRSISQAVDEGIRKFKRPEKDKPNNVLVNNYKTSDGRFLALCMLQADKYWARLCRIAGRVDLADDARFVDAAARRENLGACLAELKALFKSAVRLSLSTTSVGSTSRASGPPAAEGSRTRR